MDTFDTILLIDHQPESAARIARILHENGFATNRASNGKDALAELIDRRYDLILLDIHLPDRDGVSLIPDIRMLAPEVPVLILTEVAEADIIIDAIRKGAREYLLKPCDPGDLIFRINRVLHEDALKP